MTEQEFRQARDAARAVLEAWGVVAREVSGTQAYAAVAWAVARQEAPGGVVRWYERAQFAPHEEGDFVSRWFCWRRAEEQRRRERLGLE
jgi:hypothetical protein